jgi:hypothetical protein
MNKKAVMHVHEVRPRKDKRGVDLISDVFSLEAFKQTPLPLAAHILRKTAHFLAQSSFPRRCKLIATC